HQLAALLSWLIGIENSVNVLTASSVLIFPLGLYVLVRQQASVAVRMRSAAIAIVTPSVLLAAYAFKQLPTLFALDAALLAGAALVAYLRGGGARRLALVMALGGIVVATHHATMLFFLAPLFGAVACSELLRAKVRTRLLAWRVGLAGTGTGLAAMLVILPFWGWHATQDVAQVPIYHPSRPNSPAHATPPGQLFS